VNKGDAPRGFETAREGDWTIVAPSTEMDGARAFIMRHVASMASVLAGRSPARPGGPAGRGRIFEADDRPGRTLLVKALLRGGLPGKLAGGTYGRQRLVAEMRIMEEAAARGVPTARLAFGALSSPRGRRAAAILATVKLEDAESLAVRIEQVGLGGSRIRERNDLLGRAGAAVRLAHDLGLDHCDLNIGNILIRMETRMPGGRSDGPLVPDGIADAPGAWLIDLGLSRIGASLSPGRRASNLVRLLRSAEKHMGRDARRGRDAAAFLHGYLAAGDYRGRALRRPLLAAIRRRLPAITVHRLGWALQGSRR